MPTALIVRRPLTLTLVALLLTALCAAQPAAAAETRKVWPLFYGTLPDGKSTGSAEQMTVRLDRSDAGGVRVGFFESEFMGAGAQWRAAGWMASVVAALMSGQPPSLWRISFDVPGNIDGPSAGGLMTNAVLSMIMGQPVLDGVTMTGTINPDGSLGPVGGIYYKLAGAKAAGMRKVLIPAGDATEKIDGDKKADLFQRGRELGLEVVAVADVGEAYQHLTGKSLPQYHDDGQPFALPKRTTDALENSYVRWAKKFDQAVEAMRQASANVPGQFHPKLKKVWDTAHAQRQRAQTAKDQGALCAAVQLMYNAAVTADIGAYFSHLYIGYQRGGIDGMAKVLGGYLITNEFLTQFKARLTSQRIQSVTDLITLAEAFAYYDAAVGVHLNSTSSLQLLEKEKDQQKIIAILEQVTFGEALARNYGHFVDDLLYMGLRFPGPSLPSRHLLASWAQAMRLAAGSNLGYIEKAIIEPAAKDLEVTPQALMNKVLGNDHHYLLANTTYFSSMLMAQQFDDDLYKGAAMLGGSVISFSLSSMVVAKYYCLGAQPDADGEIVKLNAPEGLEPMLTSARRQLRQVVLAARAQGCTPIIPIFHLRTADYLAQPGMALNDRMNGMGECWIGSTFGRLMVALARH